VSGGYAITHTASAAAINYYYVVLSRGQFSGQEAWIDGSSQPAYGYIYDLSFDARPIWRSTFLDQPQFQGQPLPPDLLNKTPQELLNYGATVTNAVSLSPTNCLNIDQSPELRRHPILDQFVSDLNKDPLALANYVQNEIALSDAIAYRDDGQVTSESVNLGGVNRSALAVYQEGQGSPMEQCALLIYLLRQAGYPATYVFPPDGGIKMLDTRLSDLLRVRVNGGQDENSYLYTTNHLIPVNYPWVATYISNQWVHLYPWLKDTQVIEGLNLYDYLPDQYKQLQLWVKDYVLGKTNIMAFATPDDDTPATVFPAYLNNYLLTNAPGISLDDIGMQYVDRRHVYAAWSDFPRPTWVTNTSTAVESLASTGITNVSPRLTNVFDTVYVELFSLINPGKIIRTSEMRMADLHNRKFFLTHTNLGGGLCQATLTLAAYGTNATGLGSWATNDIALTNKQVASLTLDGSDDQLRVRIRYRRQRALTWQTAVDVPAGFLEVNSAREVLQERKLRKGDVAALCLNTGRVTPAMLRVHAQDLWNMAQQLSTNAAAASTISPDVYQGSLVYLMGMSYYERVARFDDLNRRLNKIQEISRCAMGLAKLSPRRNSDGSLPDGTIDPAWPNVDMFFLDETYVGNDTTRLDSGWDTTIARRNYANLAAANGSAQEYAVLNQFFGQSNAVSTVKVLQLAQSEVSTGAPPVVELNYYNYATAGNTLYNGIALKNYDPDIWGQVTNMFASPITGPFVVAWLPPGAQSTASGSYSGMAALVLGVDQQLAIIGNNQYGGFADPLPPSTVAPANTPQYNLQVDSQGNFHWSAISPQANQNLAGPEAITTFDILQTIAALNNNAYAANPFQTQMGQAGGLVLNGASATYSSVIPITEDIGTLDTRPDSRDGNGPLQKVFDPVNALTGEYYVDEVDLSLPGPMPLQVRRNYGSQNLANNQLGYGWKLNYMPYLTIAPSNNVVYEAEPDGSVFALAALTTNTWAPTTALNPTLNNDSANGIGSVANHLNARLVKLVVNATNTWYLTNGDGSVRVFQEMSFPLTNSAAYDRLRPYLTAWYDNRTNSYRFEYGTNATAADYGQVRRILSSSGNIVRFQYDVYGRIVDVFSIDGRHIQYDYDKHGDLVTVTLPDTSQITYEYQHLTWTANNVTNVYSTHLVIREDKPDGRLLQNDYDDQRRVTNQWATVGPDLRLVRNASFIYTNNFNLTNLTATLTGTTTILDYTNNPTTYFYTNGLIRRVRDPLGGEIVQAWYEETETNAPAYPRSLKTVTDKRGSVTTFQYDGQGNATNTTLQGDLRGDGDTTATAVITATFNANNLPTQRVDASGITNLFFYTNTWLLARMEIWPSNAMPAQAITNLYTYTTVTNSADGTVSYGLRSQEIRAAGSPDAATNQWTYSSRGFPTIATRYTGNNDPLVNVTNFFNTRGELVAQTNAVGTVVRFGFDPRGYLQSREVYASGQPVPLSWDYFYYNQNGELTWSDGPHYNPEDYVWRDYDGAGRKTTEIRWRCEAKPDGTGVQAPTADTLYATTFSQFDPFGNNVQTTDPLGRYTLRRFDALGQLVREEFYDPTGALLATNGFAYNLAGDVTNKFNALGGREQLQFTSTAKIKSRTNPDGSTNAWRYYSDGRVKREIQRNGAYWETTYDDANRKSTRIFHSASGSSLATNSTVLDRRGNVVQTIDAGFNVFTNLFDGLDRLKVAAGPPIVTIYNPNPDPGSGSNVTNILQQITTRIYDASGTTLIVSNALGEKTVTTTDPIGRVSSVQIFASNSITPVRVTTTAYAADHHSMTVTNGSGTGAIRSTTFTDNDDRTLLSVTYPAASVNEYTLHQFDLAGNLIYEERDSSSNGVATTWTQAAYVLDGLNRVIEKADRDAAATFFYRDPAGNVTNQVMPGGSLQWQALYNNAGQMLKDWNLGVGGAGTHTNTYAYYPNTSAFAGLRKTRTDGRGVTCTNLYDDWLRLVTESYTGPLPQHHHTFNMSYDARGSMTYAIDNYAYYTPFDPFIIRSYDPYGQLSNEKVGSSAFSTADQVWDSAGRRTSLDFGAFKYGYGWRADGVLASVSTPNGAASYNFDTAGLLTNRIVGNRVTTVTSRDGSGRPLSITNTVNAVARLGEILSWTGDGLLNTHTLAREDFTDSRSYTYGSMTRRLASEALSLDGTKRWTNGFTYDGGIAAGPGGLTTAGSQSSSSARWTGNTDAFSRVATETNTVSRRTAYGRVNGPSTILCSLDNQPMPMEVVGTADHTWSSKWLATLELTPGAHQLTASALHPSGLFTTNVGIWVTNNATSETVSDTLDGAGNVTQRIWRSPNGPTNRTQALTYDARGRLYEVSERDSSTNGYDWYAYYDPLDRKIETQTTFFTNGVSPGYPQTYIDSFYDPSVEFLELGMWVNFARQTWKLYGPDLDGRYGGLNGTGGLDAIAEELGVFKPLLSDARGNVLAYYDPGRGSNAWTSARTTGYGAVAGYRPLPMTSGANLAQAVAWRGRYADITGYIWLGARYYNPESGSFLSSDPVWNGRDPNYFTFAGGDPINGFDADGRWGKAVGQRIYNAVVGNIQAAGEAEDLYNTQQAAGWSYALGDRDNAQQLQSAADADRAAIQARADQSVADYQANYKYYGNNTALALNATFNPAVNAELSVSEAYNGVGLHYQNSGQTLDYQQKVNAAADFTVSSLDTVVSAYALEQTGSALRSAKIPSLGGASAEDLYPRYNYSESFKRELAEYHTGPDGKIYDPSGIEIKPGEYWEIGHAGDPYSVRVQKAIESGMSAEQWYEQEHDVRTLRPELRYSNRSNLFQDWTSPNEPSIPGVSR
jgi:RHS repeat-associated protein